jgi:ankyrin repeat protein
MNEIEQTGNTALHNACMNGNIAIAEKLIRHGAWKTLRNKLRTTALTLSIC